MTKKEKEILKWMIDRSWEKKVDPVAIAYVLAGFFPDNVKEVNQELESLKKEANEDNI